jgi:hypothetical protein
MRHESRHVKSAHADQAHVRSFDRKRQRARLLVMELRFGHDTSARHQRQSFIEDAPLGIAKVSGLDEKDMRAALVCIEAQSNRHDNRESDQRKSSMCVRL